MNYNEFELLLAYLKQKKMNYSIGPLYSGRQVYVYDHGALMWDVVIHEHSYGSDDGLLELMNYNHRALYDFCPKYEVRGYLKASDIIKELERCQYDY